MIAFALGRYRFRARSTTNLLIFMPMATPEVVMGSSLLTLFLMMGLPSGGLAVTIAHIMFCISFVVVAVKARVATLDPRLEEAAADLGANPGQTFLRVTFPLAAPGILAGALLAFSLSFDDYIITNFNASPSSITFPMYVWGAAQRGAPVQVNVIGTLMFLIALFVVVIGQVPRTVARAPAPDADPSSHRPARKVSSSCASSWSVPAASATPPPGSPPNAPSSRPGSSPTTTSRARSARSTR